MTAKHLRELRALANVSQVELAKRAGIDRSRLSMFENGHVELTEVQKIALVDVLQKAVLERSAQLIAANASVQTHQSDEG